MRVFLRLRDAELALAGLGDRLAEGVVHQFLVEEDVHAGERGVVRSQAAIIERDRMHSLFGHVALRQHGGQLAGAVVAEIVEDDGVAFFHLRQRCAGGVGDYDRLDEFVGHVGVIGGLDALQGGSERGALAFDQQVIGLFHAVPALVAVHRIEAAADGRHLAGGLLHLLLQLFHEAVTAARVGVAAVHEAVDESAVADTRLLRLGEELVEVLQAGVDAAVRAEAHEMELLPARLDILIGSLDFGILHQRVLAAGDVDLHEVLIDDTAGAEVHVSHFGVTHLAVREADVFAAGLEVAGGIFRAKRVDFGGSLRPDGVGIIMLALAPTVEDHKEYFSVHCCIFFSINS